MSIKSSEFSLNRLKLKVPENKISVTLITSDGLPVCSLNVMTDLSEIVLLKNLSADVIRYAGLSYATVMLFKELTGGMNHNHTVMEGEDSKVVISSIRNFTALTITPKSFQESQISELLNKSVEFWLNRS